MTQTRHDDENDPQLDRAVARLRTVVAKRSRKNAQREAEQLRAAQAALSTWVAKAPHAEVAPLLTLLSEKASTKPRQLIQEYLERRQIEASSRATSEPAATPVSLPEGQAPSSIGSRSPAEKMLAKDAGPAN